MFWAGISHLLTHKKSLDLSGESSVDPPEISELSPEKVKGEVELSERLSPTSRLPPRRGEGRPEYIRTS